MGVTGIDTIIAVGTKTLVNFSHLRCSLQPEIEVIITLMGKIQFDEQS